MYYKKKYKRISKQAKKNCYNNLWLKSTFGLQNKKIDFITPNQIESIRKLLIRKFKKKFKLIIRYKNANPVTKKVIGTRMGKGSGNLDGQIFLLSNAIVFIEFFNSSFNFNLFKKVLKQLQKKQKFKFLFIQRNFF